jgi:hypothetical protein
MKNPTTICQTNMKAYDSELFRELKKQSGTNEHKSIDLKNKNISLEYVFRIPRKLNHSQIGKAKR